MSVLVTVPSVIKVSELENVGDLIACVLRFGSAPLGLVGMDVDVVDPLVVEADFGRISESVFGPVTNATDVEVSIAPCWLLAGLLGPSTTVGEFAGLAERRACFGLRLSFGIREGGEPPSAFS